MIEMDYARAILALVGRVRLAFEPVLAAAPALLDAAAEDRARTDAGEADRLRELVAIARDRLAAAIEPRELQDLAHAIATRTGAFHRDQLGRQVRAALGVDVLTSDRRLPQIMGGFVAENVALIKAVPEDVARSLEQVITRGVASGDRWRDIAKDVDKTFASGRERAHLIARDQVGKFYGQVNETRQKEIGVTKYTWRTVHDVRVRGTPGGAYASARYSHFHRDGVVFEWEHPPPDGHPGTPILCRCYADPVLTDILGDPDAPEE
jgi:SPP1 gp7 family putative phage head morphogenesis protein